MDFLNAETLPIIFATLMGISILAYVILDGYDLGVGMLMSQATLDEKNLMISSIGPFWDANETWLVLGIGLLLVAFPMAHGIILTALYIPTAIMLGGLILRGVSFDFRAKAKDKHKHIWDRTFIAGSFISSMAQGYMLGLYILGFEHTPKNIIFGLITGLCLSTGYCFMGASWLIMKTEEKLQLKAIKWARVCLWGVTIGMVLISLETPLINPRIFEKWFSVPNIFYLMPLPLLVTASIIMVEIVVLKLPLENDRLSWVPMLGGIIIFILCFIGLAYSFYPYIIQDRLTIFAAASAPESLKIILFGTVIVLPCIIAYTVFAYRIFHGKVTELTYY